MRKIILLSILPLALLPSCLLAQPQRPPIMGEIQIEEQEKKKDPYPAQQAEAIEYFKRLQGRLEALKEGKTFNAETLSDSSLNYLAGAYLFCATRSGICPLIPEALLEAELVNSVANGKVACPQMKKFWGFWVKSDMETRLSYTIQPAQMSTVSEFNKDKRPALIKCEATVQGIAPEGKLTGTAARQRYSLDPAKAVIGQKTAALLEAVKQKVPNVFYCNWYSISSAKS